MTSLRVAAWSAWAPGIETPEDWRRWAAAPSPPVPGDPPAVKFLAAMQRRRCDPLSRAMLHVANECCDEATRAEAACVFASRHGPFGTMIALLEGLATGDAPSPARFSHSVHNTQSGLYSIWAKNRAPAMSLAAADDTFCHGLLDAAVRLQREPERKVLLIAGDEPIPESIAPKADHHHALHAVAMLLEPVEDQGERLDLEIALATGSGDAEIGALPGSLPDPLVFLHWWLSGEPSLSLERPPRRWILSRG